MKVGVVIPVLNNFQGAVDLIHSAKSKDHDVRFYIEQQYRHRKPLAQAWNHGFDRAVADGCKYILICNDDIILGPDSIDNAVMEMDRLRNDNVIMVTANNLAGQLHDNYDIMGIEEHYAPGSISDSPNYACFLVDRTFFDKVGRFDENFAPAWCEDQDSHQRIHILGYRAVCTTAFSCVHIGGVSTKLLGNNDSSHSVNYFIRKWGSHHPTPPQAFSQPYNNPNLTPQEWEKA